MDVVYALLVSRRRVNPWGTTMGSPVHECFESVLRSVEDMMKRALWVQIGFSFLDVIGGS